MAKKQKRYYLPNPVSEVLPQFIGHKVTIVMQNGRVFYLYLQKIQNQILHAVDMKNIRHKLNQAHIAELIVDKEI